MTAASGEFRREIESIGEVFAFLDDFSKDQQVDDKTAFCVNLVVEELFTNMVRHNEGGGDQITVSIERLDNHLHLELIDTDVEPFDPATAATPPIDAGIEDTLYNDLDGTRNDIGARGGAWYDPDGWTTDKPVVISFDLGPQKLLEGRDTEVRISEGLGVSQAPVGP